MSHGEQPDETSRRIVVIEGERQARHDAEHQPRRVESHRRCAAAAFGGRWAMVVVVVDDDGDGRRKDYSERQIQG